MKKNVWLLIELMIGPFLLFGQSTSTYSTDIRQNNLSLSTNDQMTSNNADTIIQYDVEPKLVKRVEPKYPATMIKDLWEADVILKAFIDINGNVTDVQIIQKKILPYKGTEAQKKDTKVTEGKEFEDSAIATARQWKFIPAQKSGKSVATWVTIPFRFSITTSDEKSSKDSTARNEYDRIFKTAYKIIDNVLTGKNIDEVIHKYLHPDAYIICENKYASLYDVLKNENKEITLVEGEKFKLHPMGFSISYEKNTLSLSLKSQKGKDGPERFHTILFMKSKNEDWKLRCWHVSW